MSAHELPESHPDHPMNNSADQQFFAEEIDILRITLHRIHRQCVHLAMHDLDATLDTPYIEADVLAEVDGMDEMEEAFAELDEAKAGEDPVSMELKKWAEELAASA